MDEILGAVGTLAPECVVVKQRNHRGGPPLTSDEDRVNEELLETLRLLELQEEVEAK
jgi:hypothetical protein